jgi:CBS domain containing-hemolysin-like protein
LKSHDAESLDNNLTFTANRFFEVLVALLKPDAERLILGLPLIAICGATCRVPSDMPLYDILNEFQKGGSHMAAVTKVKSKKKAKSKPQETDANSEADLEKGLQDENSSEIESKKAEEDDLNDQVNEGEVIGILTLEDVMEELLQVRLTSHIF